MLTSKHNSWPWVRVWVRVALPMVHRSIKSHVVQRYSDNDTVLDNLSFIDIILLSNANFMYCTVNTAIALAVKSHFERVNAFDGLSYATFRKFTLLFILIIINIMSETNHAR